jgi:hypothetical protein
VNIPVVATTVSSQSRRSRRYPYSVRRPYHYTLATPAR